MVSLSQVYSDEFKLGTTTRTVGNGLGSGVVGSAVGSAVGTVEGAQIEPELPTNIFQVETPLKSHQQIT